MADIPEIRAELVNLVTALLKDMRRTIMIGDERSKQALLKILLPDLLRRTVQSDSTDDDLRKEFLDLMAEVRGETRDGTEED